MFKISVYGTGGSIYAAPGVMDNAVAAKMGDTAAMLELARFFRGRVPAEGRAVLDGYEAGSNASTRFAVQQWLRKSSDPGHCAMAYMMWLTRAAFYGNLEARELSRGLDLYGSWPYMCRDMLEHQTLNKRNVWSSTFLRDMGVLDMDFRREDCSVIFIRKLGIYIFSYVSDYIPADSEGFGAEYDYGHVYFDEFFNRLRAPDPDAAAIEAAGLERAREAYWADPARDSSRRYVTTARRRWEVEQK